MKYLHKLVLSVASAAFFIASAQAQNAGTVTNHAVPLGKGPGVTGFTSLPPGAAGIPLTSTGASSDPSFSAIAAAGIQSNAVTNAKVQPGAANTFKGSLDGVSTSDIALTACTLTYQITKWVAGTGWQCGLNPVLPSRTIAATLDLSAFSAVQTLGYATAGDGGGGTFANKTTTPFRDSFVVTPTVTGNGTSGCTNGTYLGVAPSGGTGTNLLLTVTVAGNVVSAVALAGTGGNGYTTNDTVSTTITGCSTTVTFSVGTVSTPSCSFSDSASNHWQLLIDSGLNVRQCGAKVNYLTTDAGATNDYTAIQNAYSFCGDIHGLTIDGGGSAGCKVMHPPGNSLICGSVPLEVPQGVLVEGANMWASTLKMCAAWTSGTTFINLCNPNTHLACFGTMLRNITLYSPFAQSSSANSYMVYSNNIQQVDVLDRVAIYAGQRECLRLETGYGGAALLGMQNVECTPGTTSTNAGITINYGTTLVTMRNVHVETGGPATLSGISITGGFVHLTGFHTEGISTGMFVNIPTSIANGFVKIEDITGGVNCTNLVVKQAGSAASSVYVSNATQNGCTNTVNNGGALTTAFVGIWTLY
jgi:hypothetical protein